MLLYQRSGLCQGSPGARKNNPGDMDETRWSPHPAPATFPLVFGHFHRFPYLAVEQAPGAAEHHSSLHPGWSRFPKQGPRSQDSLVTGVECWTRGQGEDEVVVKTVFGMAASFMGIVLVCGGSYGLAVSVTLSDSEPQFTEPLTG